MRRTPDTCGSPRDTTSDTTSGTTSGTTSPTASVPVLRRSGRPGRLVPLALLVALAALPTAAYATTTTSPSGSTAPVLRAAAQEAPAVTPGRTVRPAAASGLDEPAKKEIAMQLVSSAENSSLDWKDQYRYIEDIGDGRGYTAGIIGFCSGTGDMLELVEHYADLAPGNGLERFLPALRAVNGTDSHEGLGAAYEDAWREAAKDPVFQRAQNEERDRVYFGPAVAQGVSDQVGTLGQFIYYDAIVMHGPGEGGTSFGGIRARALRTAVPPARGGDETRWLNAFLDARVWAMKQESAHEDTSRVDTAQRVFLDAGNLNLDPPLDWKVYGDSYHIG
ncbi:chitosanase [Streptomyces sp. NPDC007088]|uniref:chitosanase n=1 Tax=Streptomyces sp. NPDC007088 TaxID=3364773 RepID=UPI0036B5C0F3